VPEEAGLIAGWQMAKNLTVPVLIGGGQESLQRDYHINSTPSTYLLDENGRVLFREDGYTPGDEKTLEAKIEAALNIVPTGPASAPIPSRSARPEDLQPSAAAPQMFNARPRE
jgi:hypothetical protein